MGNNKRNAIVVGGSMRKDGMIEIIEGFGVFESFNEAYGEALSRLYEASQGYDDDMLVTVPYELEAETGFGMHLVNKDGSMPDITDFAYVLFNDNSRVYDNVKTEYENEE